MGKPKKLSWTPKQQEVREFLRQGLPPQEIVAKGYSKTMVSRVNTELKKSKTQDETKPPPSQPDPQSETHIRPRTLESVSVGEILIVPADWRINQFGGFLILSTYEHARRACGYTGTVGEFICDCTQIIRVILGLDMVSTDYLWQKEDDNGRRETSQGSTVLAAVGKEADGGAAKPTE